MRPALTINAAVTAQVLAVARDLGVDVDDLRRRTGFTVDVQSQTRVPDAQHLLVWEHAMRACGDASLPIRYAERTKMEDFGVLGLACKTAANLHEALLRLARHTAVIAEGVRCNVVCSGDRAYVCVDRAGDGLGQRVAVESVLAELWTALQGLSAHPEDLIEVWHRHEPPDDLRAHRRHYGRAVRFGCDRDALVLDAGALRRELPMSDAALSNYFLDQLEAATPSATWAGRVAEEIERALPNGTPTLATCARTMGASQRSLQRYLATEGTSFQDVLSETRRDLAERWLGRGSYSIAEVAFMLGFSEPSAFHRAFRRWTGSTPGAHATAA